jgi:hypothetical protein
MDLVLAVMAGEFAWLSLRGQPGRRLARMVDLGLALGPGALLALALRAALTGAGWMWIAGLLAASLPIHVADMRRRRL